MGNTAYPVITSSEEFRSSSGKKNRSPFMERGTSMTCTISDKWRSSQTEKGFQGTSHCPQVTQFEVEPEEPQPEIREQSVVYIAPSLVSQESTPPKKLPKERERTPFKHAHESSSNYIENEEDKLVSLCLMAMNLEALAEEENQVYERHPVAPAELTLLKSEHAAKRVLKSMDLEEIGSLSIDFSQDRPKLTVKDSISGVCQSGFLKAVEGPNSRQEVARLHKTVDSLTKVIKMLTSQMTVLDERIRCMEGCDTITMKE